MNAWGSAVADTNSASGDDSRIASAASESEWAITEAPERTLDASCGDTTVIAKTSDGGTGTEGARFAHAVKKPAIRAPPRNFCFTAKKQTITGSVSLFPMDFSGPPSTSPAPRWLRALVGLQVRRPFVPIIVVCITALVGFLLAARLELKTRFDQLLPENQPSVREIRRVMDRTRAASKIFVVLEGEKSEELRTLGNALTERLPSAESRVETAEDSLAAAKSYLEPRAGLFLPKDELRKLRDDVDARWEWEVARQDGSAFDETEAPPPELSAEELKKRFKKYEPNGAQSFPDGYFQSQDRRALVVMAQTLIPSGDLTNSKIALSRVKEQVAATKRELGFDHVRVGYAGDLVSGLNEYGAIRDDLTQVGSLGVLFVLIVVLLYFMRLRALFTMGITIGVGIAWTFGITKVCIGHLNVVTGALFSIIAGNGINFGILYMARYFEERRLGRPVEDAILIAHRTTMSATLTVAMGAAAAYGSLGISEFRVFRHFAFIGATGMACCWIATYWVTPALLAAIERRWPFGGNGTTWFSRIRLRGIPYSALLIPTIRTIPRFLAGAGILAAVAGVVCTVEYMRHDPMEYNMRRLENDLGGAKESSRISRLASDIMGRRFDAGMVVMAERIDQVRALKAMLEKKRDEAPPDEKPFEAVHTAVDFVPEDQPDKIPLLVQIREKLIRARELKVISDQEWQELTRVMPPEDLKPITLESLPEQVVRPFMERDGTRGRIVVVEPTAGTDDSDLRYLLRWADSFRETKLPNGEIVRGSGRPVIFADMLKSVIRDVPRAVALSLGLTLLAVVLLFRRGRQSFMVVGALLLGVAWLGLYMQITHTRLNFVNFVALPVTFGVGVDYAVNIVQRYTSERGRNILRAVRTTGGAVVLCSSTTTLGYLALLGSINQAIRGLGAIAVIGEVTCLGAAVLVLPAILYLRERSKNRTRRSRRPPQSLRERELGGASENV